MNNETLMFGDKEYQGRWIEVAGQLFFVIDESLEQQLINEMGNGSPLGIMMKKGIFLFAPKEMICADEKDLGTYLIEKIFVSDVQQVPA